MSEDLKGTSPVIPAGPERSDLEPLFARRHAALSAVIGLGASMLSGLYLWRAVDQGGTAPWVVGLVLGMLAMFHLTQWVDARTPLLVADATGVRLRLGNVWHGLLWDDVSRVTVRERQGLFRDGRVVVHPADEAALRGLAGRSRRRLAANTRMYGAPFALPLGLTTVTSTDDLAGRLEVLAGPDTVVEVAEPEQHAAPSPRQDTTPGPEPTPEPEPGHEPEPRPEPQPTPEPEPAPEPGPSPEPAPARAPTTADTADTADTPDTADTAHTAHTAHTADTADTADTANTADTADIADIADTTQTTDTATAPQPPPEPPRPARPVRRALRSDITRPPTVRAPIVGQLALQEPLDDDGRGGRGRPGDGPEPPRPRGGMSLVLGQTPSSVVPQAEAPGSEATDPQVRAPAPAAPAMTPVIGPTLAEARTLLGLSVDDLAARTRIRPHVIDAIEVDDFGPCAGDFYARGHLRALGRVLGIDPEPLVREYEERYAGAPIDARRVFEAELAAGDSGPFRGVGTHSRPRWGGLIIAVLVLIVVWTLASVYLDGSGTPLDDGVDSTRGSAPVSPASAPVSPASAPTAGTGSR